MLKRSSWTFGGSVVRAVWAGVFATGLSAAFGAGCLSRPVTHREPTTKTNFTDTVGQAAVDKVDILFMIDNSQSMGDKQELLAKAVPDLVNRLLNPLCLDASKKPAGLSTAGKCPDGQKPEFAPIVDMHIGIISSALGGRGSDSCNPKTANPRNPALNGHNDDGGRLINRAGDDESPIPEANPSNFLAWFPTSDRNRGKPEPPVAAIKDPSKFENAFKEMIRGVHEFGCGYEAQLESWYRFLIQPDPYERVELDGEGKATYVGVDAKLLKQRHDFLRPDSLVAIILVTDEDDSNVDPMAINRQGWAFANANFPGSNTGRAPKGTVECESDPTSDKCTTCAFIADGEVSSRCPGGEKYYQPADDSPDVRFFHMKRRFGVDPQFPISRYVTALTSRRVPNRDTEHRVPGTDKAYSSDYQGSDKRNQVCLNPLFAASLPEGPEQSLCADAAGKLPPEGPRSEDLIFYAVIGGVPNDLLLEDSADEGKGIKTSLSEADWNKILGKEPLKYNFDGIDARMLQSTEPRAGRPGPSAADYDATQKHRDWLTAASDLQYACTFALESEKPCGATGLACDCDGKEDPPLCKASDKTVQVRGKAYPTIRELAVARELGERGIVASLCPIHEQEQGANDPLYGYRPAVKSIIDRLANALAAQCLPQPLTPAADGKVPCLVLTILPEGRKCSEVEGLTPPDAAVLQKFLESERERSKAEGGPAEVYVNQEICEVRQVVAAAGQTCIDDPAAAWCYVGGAEADRCAQAILFSEKWNGIGGAKARLQCINESAADGGR